MTEKETKESLELRREADWIDITKDRKLKLCTSKKVHGRHIWNSPEPHVDGFYCNGWIAQPELDRKKRR